MTNDLKYENVVMEFSSRGTTVRALDTFNFAVSESEFIVVVGPSGCGKSTLMHMTAGLLHPTSGRVFLGGAEIKDPGPDKAVVFQSFSLFPWKSVRENIDFGLRINGKSVAERRELVARAVKLIGLDGFEDHYPRQLSGGMQQRVAIARSFVMSPRVLLMDEPFAALDAQNRQLMQEELVRIWASQRPTVVFITHSVEEAVFLADRIVVMSKRPGRVKKVIDVNAATGATHWRTEPFEDVIRRPVFQDLRADVWGLVKSEISLRN